MRSYVIVALAAAAISWWWLSSPTTPRREPVAVGDGMVVVENQTEREWRTIRITVNDHFFGGAQALAAGGRLTAPLSQFQTAHGVRYDRGRMSPKKVVVTATDADGKPVSLEWGGDRAR